MRSLYLKIENFVQKLVDLPLLLIRLILASVFFKTGLLKWQDIESITSWFEFLNIPLPKLNAYLAASTEVAGFALLLVGLGTRIISIPLIILLVVAIITVHWSNGWLAIADSEMPEIADRLDRAKSILKNHGNYEWLTEKGSFVILNNGIEFAAIYIVMLLILLSVGPGKISLDYVISRFVNKSSD